jgi:hypothetical protein
MFGVDVVDHGFWGEEESEGRTGEEEAARL